MLGNFPGCFKENLGVFQVSFQWDSRAFERNLKDISGKFQMCLEEISRVFQENSKGIQVRLKGI